ncbi:DUF6233 domain-containing protein [Streptomyces sp. NPDC053726]|uniref:DUF6233 domain-containing protein n=1 Tax=Streptomyces sp. NPDC053726 TaxID=3365713 RepID=UPI0037D7D25D
MIELAIGLGARPIEVHAGHCYAIGKRHRAITREQALAALAEGIRPCAHCRPDTELGVLGQPGEARGRWVILTPWGDWVLGPTPAATSSAPRLPAAGLAHPPRRGPFFRGRCARCHAVAPWRDERPDSHPRPVPHRRAEGHHQRADRRARAR